MRDAIANRISRRTYTDPLTAAEVARIRELCAAANEGTDLRLELVEDGGAAFSSTRRTYGFFAGVRSVILVKVAKDAASLTDATIEAGRRGERIVLELTDIGLGTCWVGGTFDRRAFNVPANEELLLVITVGHAPELTLRERGIRSVVSKRRKPAEQRLVTDGSVDEPWLWDGLEAVRLAPSAVNSQHPFLVVEKNVITMDVAGSATMDLIDLGIAMCHFEEGAGGHFVGDPVVGRHAKFARD